MPGRTDQAIKNRYNNYLKPKEGRKPLPHAEKLYAQAAASTRATDGGMTCYELSAHYHGDDDALASAACSARDRFKSSAFGHPMVTYAEPVGPSAYPSSSAGRALSHKGALGSAATVSAPQHLPAGHAAGGNKMPTRADRRRDDQLEQDGPTSALRIEQADITLPGEAIDEMVRRAPSAQRARHARGNRKGSGGGRRPRYRIAPSRLLTSSVPPSSPKVYTSTLLTLVVASEDTSDRDRVINRLIGSLAACVHRAAEDSSAEMQQ